MFKPDERALGERLERPSVGSYRGFTGGRVSSLGPIAAALQKGALWLCLSACVYSRVLRPLFSALRSAVCPLLARPDYGTARCLRYAFLQKSGVYLPRSKLDQLTDTRTLSAHANLLPGRCTTRGRTHRLAFLLHARERFSSPKTLCPRLRGTWARFPPEHPSPRPTVRSSLT